jgi:hypothetical protein
MIDRGIAPTFHLFSFFILSDFITFIATFRRQNANYQLPIQINPKLDNNNNTDSQFPPHNYFVPQPQFNNRPRTPSFDGGPLPIPIAVLPGKNIYIIYYFLI